MENEKLTYINSRGERLELGVDSVYHCNISKDVEGIQIDARITEVTETYQKGEETIEATFGDSLPTLVDQIRKVR